MRDAAAIGGDEGALMNLTSPWSRESEQDDLLELADFSPDVLGAG